MYTIYMHVLSRIYITMYMYIVCTSTVMYMYITLTYIYTCTHTYIYIHSTCTQYTHMYMYVHTHTPILVHSSPSIVSGFTDGALVSEEIINTSHDWRCGLSIGQGCVVNVDDEET